MRVSRALFGCLVVASCQSFVYSQDSAADSELILGPVVPMGVLERQASRVVVQHVAPKFGPNIPLDGGATTELRRYTAVRRLPVSNHELGFIPTEVAPTPVPQVHTTQPRVIRQPAVAPTIQMVHRVAPVPQALAVHPDQVQAHLATAIQSLQTAGLMDEANQVLAIQQRFLQNRYQDLLVAHKESQVQMLQAEIARLKQHQSAAATEAQVHLQLHVVHVNHSQREELIKALWDMSSHDTPSNSPQVVNPSKTEGFHHVDSSAVQALLKDLVERQCAKIAAEPNAVVLNGRTVHFACDPESSRSLFVVAGQRDRVPPQNSGSMFEICPNVMPSGEIRLRLLADVLCQLPKSSSERDERMSPRRRIRIETVTELPPGRTIAFVGPSVAPVEDQPNGEYAPCDLILVTPTLIHGPASMPVPSPAPFPVEYQISRPVVEAKN